MNENILLERIGISKLNAMQAGLLENYQAANNIQLISPTGTGKTIGFLLPMILGLQPANNQVQVMIIAPSRELCLQIDEVCRKMATGFKVTCCYGGHKREIEEKNLVEAPAIIIGTAGRLADHIRRNNFNPDTIETLIVDEFDKTLELGFQEEMSFIISSLPNIKKRLFTSATAATSLPVFAGFSSPLLLDYSSVNLIEKSIYEQLIIMVLNSENKDKSDTLIQLLYHLNNKSAIVFLNHREAIERLNEMVKNAGLVPVFYHGGMEQHEREVALCKFKNGTSNILLTTDLAARGLDFAAIKYVVHYHLPDTADAYTHRNGRTARMQNGGKVIIMLGPGEVVPKFVNDETEPLVLPEQVTMPEKPGWSTLFIAAGKKDKINKVDIVGFLSKTGALKKDDLGLIEVKDFAAFAAIRKNRMGQLLENIKDQKIKGKKVKMAIAK
jgi:superfamily II DNA/RNA helicase